MPLKTRFSELQIAVAHRDHLRGATWAEVSAPYDAAPATFRGLFVTRGLPLIARQNGRVLPQRIVVPTDPAVLGYIAAMIDGEGYITCSHQTKRNSVCWRVGVANTDRRLIDWLLRAVPGTARTRKRQRAVPKWPGERLPCYEWLVRGARDIHALLCALGPYLIIKEDRARGAIAWAEDRMHRYERAYDRRLVAAADQRILELQRLQISVERVEIESA